MYLLKTWPLRRWKIHIFFKRCVHILWHKQGECIIRIVNKVGWFTGRNSCSKLFLNLQWADYRTLYCTAVILREILVWRLYVACRCDIITAEIFKFCRFNFFTCVNAYVADAYGVFYLIVDSCFRACICRVCRACAWTAWALLEQAASEIAVKPDITPVNIRLRFAINTSKFLYRVWLYLYNTTERLTQQCFFLLDTVAFCARKL